MTLHQGKSPILRTSEVAARLGVIQKAVRGMIQRGELYGQKAGGWYIIPAQDVERIVAERHPGR